MRPVGPPILVLPSEASELCLRAGRGADAPLWVAGSLAGLCAPAVAMVGSRAPSGAGRRLAFQTARQLGAAGVCVVSGLALGIDAAAREGALAAGAPTVGVLGGGHDRFFPKANRELADRIIARGGAVVSPYEPARPAEPWQFLERNAIVAGLSDGVVVVEAAARSGALNTASHAANLGIPVMAFPGDVDRPKVAGCLGLLRDGATLVRDAADILEALGLAVEPASNSARKTGRLSDRRLSDAGLSNEERAILTALADGELDFDTLLARCRARPGELVARLVELELRGVVESRMGGSYVLK